MTLAEMEAAYPDEWVLIADVDWDEEVDDVRGGRVVFHSADRDTAETRLVQLKLRSAGIFFLGPLLAPGIDGVIL
jgi:hypothetical protein